MFGLAKVQCYGIGSYEQLKSSNIVCAWPGASLDQEKMPFKTRTSRGAAVKEDEQKDQATRRAITLAWTSISGASLNSQNSSHM
jgi:hypothetical protein